MKAHTMKNPLIKLINKSRGKNKFDDDESLTGSSSSYSIDGSNHAKNNPSHSHSLFAVSFDDSNNVVHNAVMT